jgi:hypothetical protein
VRTVHLALVGARCGDNVSGSSSACHTENIENSAQISRYFSDYIL